MKDNEKPMYAVMVKDFVHFSKWLKTAPDRGERIYRPVFSMNSAVGIYFDAMIFTTEFWDIKDAKQIHQYVRFRIKDRGRVNGPNGTGEKRPKRILEKAINFLWGKG